MTPYFAGRALNLRLKSARLQSTRGMLDEAAWMPYCGMSLEIYRQHDVLMKSIEDLVHHLHQSWVMAVGDNPRAKLDRFLMRRRDDRAGHLECTIDPEILNLCRESEYWVGLRFPVPVHIRIVYDKWDTLQFVYESVLAVVISYNKVVDGSFRGDIGCIGLYPGTWIFLGRFSWLLGGRF